MTLEEAIKLLKQYQGYDPMFQDGKTLKHAFDLTDETVDTLLTALRPVSREQVERMRGEWRSIHGLSEYYCSRCGEEFEIHAYDKDKYQFCPHCMAPMTDEAVDMMLRRWKEAVDGEQSH